MPLCILRRSGAEVLLKGTHHIKKKMLEAAIFSFTYNGKHDSSMYFLDPYHRMELCYVFDDLGLDYRLVVPKVGNEPLRIHAPTLDSLQMLLPQATHPWGGFEVPKDHEKLKNVFKGIRALELIRKETPEEDPLPAQGVHIMSFMYIIPLQRCTLRRIPLAAHLQTFNKLPFMYTATNSDTWSFLLNPEHEALIKDLRSRTFCCVRTFHMAINGMMAYYFQKEWSPCDHCGGSNKKEET